jgi:hypothetical protein
MLYTEKCHIQKLPTFHMQRSRIFASDCTFSNPYFKINPKYGVSVRLLWEYEVVNRRSFIYIYIYIYIYMRNDPYTHFLQQFHNKLMWLVIFYYYFCFVFFSFCKKIIKYYQPHQLVVGLLWEMSVGTISLSLYIYIKKC